MAKAVLSLHCLVFVGASSTEQSGHHQVPASRRHDQGCVIILHSLVFLGPAPQSSRATARCLDRGDMTKAVSSLHCLVFVGASSKEQSGHRQVPGLTT